MSGSLKSYLRSTYGVQTQKTVDTFGKELQRLARFSNHHHFALRCHKSGIVPSSLRIKAPVNTERAREAAARASRVFTQERIKTSWRARNAASSCAESCLHSLRDTLSTADLSKVERICRRTAEVTFQKIKERHQCKFNKLRERLLDRQGSDERDLNLRPSWVVNLSDRQLSTTEKAVLSKGPRFAVSPKVNAVDIAAPVEAALQTSEASDQAKESARIKICEAIGRAKKPTSNFTADERRAFRELHADQDIQILHADKGNATVVLNADDYDSKVHALLDDRQSYAVLPKDPTRKTERNLLSLLRDLRKREKISEPFYNAVRPSEGSSKPARFYGRVKLHKPTAPLRPVVATCGSSTYALARKLSHILRPLVGASGRVLRNTADLVDTMEDVVLHDDEMLVSYDVKSLFTSIPVNESVDLCEQRLLDDDSLSDRTSLDVATIVRLLRFCLTSTSFLYRGQHYQQLDGVAMGSPVSPVIADIFMEDLENKAFASYSSVPRVWKRFVDDVIAVVKKDGGQDVLQHLNSQHPRIQFTMEQENNGSLPFMDCRFTRQPQGELMREVYQKPTHTNRYVQFDSHHPSSVKSGVVRCIAERAIRVSSSEEARDAEFRRISQVMVCNGYPRKFVQKAISRQVKSRAARRVQPQQDQSKAVTVRIPFIDGLSQEVRRVARAAGVRCAFYTPNTLGSLYNAKDPLPRGSVTHAVYSVKCKTCDDEYVGETRRAVDVRRKEHSDAIRLGQCSKSAIAEHVHDQQSPHEMDWSSLRVIDRACQQRERKVREAFHIYQRKPQINRDTGIERSAVWNAVL